MINTGIDTTHFKMVDLDSHSAWAGENTLSFVLNVKKYNTYQKWDILKRKNYTV